MRFVSGPLDAFFRRAVTFLGEEQFCLIHFLLLGAGLVVLAYMISTLLRQGS